MAAALLTAKQLTKYFIQGNTQVLVLNNLSMTFRQGSTYAITGISGSGKSTLMHLLAGLDSPSSGTVEYNTKNLAKLSEIERCAFLNKTIGLVFQSAYLIRELSVEENVAIPGLIAGKDRHFCLERARELLAKVGLADKYTSNVSALSGGQQQRVAIARALFNNPAFLLADEPTGNLDIKTGKTIIDLLIHCHTELQMGIIVSTHDTYVAQAMQEIYVMHDGKLSKQ